jgi:transposase-like protein
LSLLFILDLIQLSGVDKRGKLPTSGGGKEQRTDTKEFKQEAVRLVETSGKSKSQVARELGDLR